MVCDICGLDPVRVSRLYRGVCLGMGVGVRVTSGVWEVGSKVHAPTVSGSVARHIT